MGGSLVQGVARGDGGGSEAAFGVLGPTDGDPVAAGVQIEFEQLHRIICRNARPLGLEPRLRLQILDRRDDRIAFRGYRVHRALNVLEQVSRPVATVEPREGLQLLRRQHLLRRDDGEEAVLEPVDALGDGHVHVPQRDGEGLQLASERT